MVDAPVSDGIAAANSGSLTFMVGGSETAFARAEPILARMGKAIIHAGDAGAGQAAKTCNMILGSQLIATCEALALALRLGLDPQNFFDIASKASGQSWSLTSYCPLPIAGPESQADRGYEGRFPAALMLKYLKVATGAAQSVDVAVQMGAAGEALYQAFANAENGGKDFSAVISLLNLPVPA